MPQHKAPNPRLMPAGRSSGPTREQRQARQAATASSAISSSSGDSLPPTGVDPQPSILIDHQRLLDVLAHAFADEIVDPQFHARLQHIKTLFFERKFLEIFAAGDPALLATYSARYIPPRALAYLDLVRDVPVVRNALAGSGQDGMRVVAIGGGAGSELAALAFGRFAESDPPVPKPMHLATVDIGDFSPVLDRIEASLRASLPTLANNLTCAFHKDDVLSPTWPPADLAVDRADLVTLLFTLNELFAQGSKAGALGFITRLVKGMRPGALLLLADSAGSFSDIVIGKTPYKITVLLDRLPGLTRLAGDDARWFRVAAGGVRYPARIENMRFFFRVYRRE